MNTTSGCSSRKSSFHLKNNTKPTNTKNIDSTSVKNTNTKIYPANISENKSFSIPTKNLSSANNITSNKIQTSIYHNSVFVCKEISPIPISISTVNTHTSNQVEKEQPINSSLRTKSDSQEKGSVKGKISRPYNSNAKNNLDFQVMCCTPSSKHMPGKSFQLTNTTKTHDKSTKDNEKYIGTSYLPYASVETLLGTTSKQSKHQNSTFSNDIIEQNTSYTNTEVFSDLNTKPSKSAKASKKDAGDCFRTITSFNWTDEDFVFKPGNSVVKESSLIKKEKEQKLSYAEVASLGISSSAQNLQDKNTKTNHKSNKNRFQGSSTDQDTFNNLPQQHLIKSEFIDRNNFIKSRLQNVNELKDTVYSKSLNDSTELNQKDDTSK